MSTEPHWTDDLQDMREPCANCGWPYDRHRMTTKQCPVSEKHVEWRETRFRSKPEPYAGVERFDPVQRYDQGGKGYGEMEVCSDGDYVSHEDFEKLQKERDSLRDEIGRLTDRAYTEARAYRDKQFHELELERDLLRGEIAQRDKFYCEPGNFARLLSIAKRWAALDGGAWFPRRYEQEKLALQAETREAIANAEGKDQ